tara:strand:+ start:434 stop:682 length:249 start_codon:yes stop_codon:yes gene_type:complete
MTETPRFAFEYIDVINGNFNGNYNLLSKEDRNELISYLEGLITSLDEFDVGEWLMYCESEEVITKEEYMQMVNTYLENTLKP